MLRQSGMSKREGWGLALLLALLLAGWYFLRGGRGGEPAQAVIFHDGREVARLDLWEYSAPVRISMAELGVDLPVNFEVENHQIRFVDVTCPDKLCEGFGFIGRPAQTAVCMPNRVSVTISGG